MRVHRIIAPEAWRHHPYAVFPIRRIAWIGVHLAAAEEFEAKGLHEAHDIVLSQIAFRAVGIVGAGIFGRAMLDDAKHPARLEQAAHGLDFAVGIVPAHHVVEHANDEDAIERARFAFRHGIKRHGREMFGRKPGEFGSFGRKTGGPGADALLRFGVEGTAGGIVIQSDELPLTAQIMPEHARVPAAAGRIFTDFHVRGDAEKCEGFGRVTILITRAIFGAAGMINRAGYGFGMSCCEGRWIGQFLIVGNGRNAECQRCGGEQVTHLISPSNGSVMSCTCNCTMTSAGRIPILVSNKEFDDMAEQQAIIAGGCFWCTEAVMKDVIGVSEVESGYIGGHQANPTYKEVCTGNTGHAEGVRVTFDDEQITLAQLYDVFLGTHDPTQLNRQGNDVGTQYRSAIFPLEGQEEEARAAIARWNDEHEGQEAVTTIESGEWYPAEDYHQEYWDGEGQRNPYCLAVIPPKLMKLRKSFQKYLKEDA